MTDEQLLPIAQVCHEANRAFCETLGDTSQPRWEDAPDWQKTSAVAGVRFRLDNPAAPASAQHEQWMADKLADGWVYGETKDTVAKAHPCLVSYDELPDEQRAKDKLFIAVVKALSEKEKLKQIFIILGLYEADDDMRGRMIEACSMSGLKLVYAHTPYGDITGQ